MIASFGNRLVEYRKALSNRYVRLKDSIELYGADRVTYTERMNGKPPRFADKAVPDVWRIGVDGKRPVDFVQLTEDLQHWIFRLNIEIYTGMPFQSEEDYRAFHKSLPRNHQLIGWFTSVLRGNGSHTNRAGFGDKPPGNTPARNYISGEDMENGEPKLFHIVTGRWVAEKSRDVTKTIAGAMCLPVKVINISKNDYRKYHPFTHPHLFDRLMITGRYMVQDKSGTRITGYFRSPYGQFGGMVTLPVMLPFDDEGWLPVSQIVEPSDTEPGRKF